MKERRAVSDPSNYNMSKPMARKQNVVIQSAGSEMLVYDLDTNKAACLNETSANVWKHCDGSKDVASIALALSMEMGKPVDEQIVVLALEQMEANDLLEWADASMFLEHSPTRRSALLKIGFASLMALPMITTLVAPTAAQSVSCIANNQSCSTSSQCCSGCCRTVGGVNECRSGGGACLP